MAESCSCSPRLRAPLKGVHPLSKCDRNTQEWHVSSKEYFWLEHQWQHSQAQAQELEIEIKLAKQAVEDCKADATKREATAMQQAAFDAQQLYKPQVTKLIGELATLEAQLKATQQAAKTQHVHASKDIQLLQDRVADVTADLNHQKSLVRTSQLDVQQAQAAAQRADVRAEASKRETDCWKAQLDVAKAERLRIYRVCQMNNIYCPPSSPDPTPRHDITDPDDLTKKLRKLLEEMAALKQKIASLEQTKQDLTQDKQSLNAKLEDAHKRRVDAEKKLKKRGFSQWCCCLFFLCNNFGDDMPQCCIPAGCLAEWCCCLCCGCSKVHDEPQKDV